jgi:hypothetical protein
MLQLCPDLFFLISLRGPEGPFTVMRSYISDITVHIRVISLIKLFLLWYLATVAQPVITQIIQALEQVLFLPFCPEPVRQTSYILKLLKTLSAP